MDNLYWDKYTKMIAHGKLPKRLITNKTFSTSLRNTTIKTLSISLLLIFTRYLYIILYIESLISSSIYHISSRINKF